MDLMDHCVATNKRAELQDLIDLFLHESCRVFRDAWPELPDGAPMSSHLTLRLNNLNIKHSNKKLLGAPGIATRSKDATRGSWPYY